MPRWLPENERFWPKVYRTDDEKCWIWLGGTDVQGYGYFSYSKGALAHRYSYETFVGEIHPKTLCVLHHCDNPSCVNPRHLFLGTRVDNAKDRTNKKRELRGEQHPSSTVLNNKIVLAVRAAEGLQKDIAKKYGIPQQMVSAIKNFKTWAHV